MKAKKYRVIEIKESPANTPGFGIMDEETFKIKLSVEDTMPVEQFFRKLKQVIGGKSFTITPIKNSYVRKEKECQQKKK